MARDADTDALRAIDAKAREGEAAAIKAGATPPDFGDVFQPGDSGTVVTRDGETIQPPRPSDPGKKGGA